MNSDKKSKMLVFSTLIILIINLSCENKNTNSFISSNNETILFNIDLLDTNLLTKKNLIDSIFEKKFIENNSIINGWQNYYQEQKNINNIDSIKIEFLKSQKGDYLNYIIPYNFKIKNSDWYLILKKTKPKPPHVFEDLKLYVLVIKNNELKSTLLIGARINTCLITTSLHKISSKLINYKLIQKTEYLEYCSDIIIDNKISCNYDTLTEYFCINDTILINEFPYRSIYIREEKFE